MRLTLICALTALVVAAPVALAQALANPAPPSVSTRSATNLGQTSATLTGTVNPNGAATTYHFEYGTTKAYGAQTAESDAGAAGSGVRASSAIGGLQPHTTYHYRLVATSASGVARGGDHSFTTLRLPQAVTVSASPEPALWSGFVTLTGQVSGVGVGGTTVVVERQDFPFSAGFRTVATQAANGDGTFRLSVGPLWAATQLRVATRTTIKVASPVMTVRNRVVVGLRARRLRGRRLELTGAINPAVPAARVSAQRRSASGRWMPVARGGVTPLAGNRSRYALPVGRPRRAAVYRVVVLPQDGGGHVRGVSRERAV
jgi:hypothetical protein